MISQFFIGHWLTILFLLLGLILVVGFAWWRLRHSQLGDPNFRGFPVQFTDADGWRLRFHRSGRGPALLLIHGIGANLFCWYSLIPLLRKRFTVIAIDLPGFGQSSVDPSARYGLDEQVERLVAFLDQQRIEKTFVVGNSMGGNIALWLSAVHPERVLGCAVIAPATSRKLVPLDVQKVAWLSQPLSALVNRSVIAWSHRRTVSKPELVSRFRVEETYRTYGGNHKAIRSFLKATSAIRDPRLPKSLKGLKTKVLILWGSNDKLVPQQVIDELESVLANFESHVHEGGGHHLQEDEPHWVANHLTEFFK